MEVVHLFAREMRRPPVPGPDDFDVRGRARAPSPFEVFGIVDPRPGSMTRHAEKHEKDESRCVSHGRGSAVQRLKLTGLDPHAEMIQPATLAARVQVRCSEKLGGVIPPMKLLTHFMVSHGAMKRESLPERLYGPTPE